jgi:hypothetical protein
VAKLSAQAISHDGFVFDDEQGERHGVAPGQLIVERTISCGLHMADE